MKFTFLLPLAVGWAVLACDDAPDRPPVESNSDAQVHIVVGSGTGGGNATSLEIPGGTYDRTYSSNASGDPTGATDSASVSGLRLDEDLVTVGRFRPFVLAWNGDDAGAGYTPPPGSGKHTHLNGGLGLANSATPDTYEPGWLASDDANVAPTDANLACDPDYATWTPSEGGNEDRPINCVNWWESYAFCIWDGGFLPSEAEWAFTAAGGSQEREYPWGDAAPGTESRYAVYGAGDADCYYPSGAADVACTGVANIAPVGTATKGAARWGQLDMAGDVEEWTMDWSAPYVDPCVDCAYLTSTNDRVVRGGFFGITLAGLLATYRGDDPPSVRDADTGVRCARTP